MHKRLLVTGGLGFIGSNFIRHVIKERPSWDITNLDKSTYAGNPETHQDLLFEKNYRLVAGDICDKQCIIELLRKPVDVIVHFAAETHVDRSITGPEEFARTNATGTLLLLEAAKAASLERFVHISTDEVYGARRAGSSYETDALSATIGNPYAITKEAADKLAQSYFLHPHHLPVTVVRPSNNYGPYQYPEKFFPLAITNALEGKPIPLYGNGQQMRDWLFVKDTARALVSIIEHGKAGEIYNLGSTQLREYTNKEIVEMILDHLRLDKQLITYVPDRPHHDVRYSVNCKKVTEQTGWAPQYNLLRGLEQTIDWYGSHTYWWKSIKSGQYKQYYRQQYGP